MRVDLSSRTRLEFHGARVSSDRGLLAYRQVDEKLALTAAATPCLIDARRGLNKRHCLTSLLRQSIYARLAGYEDVNDAEWLRVAPVFGQLIGGRAAERGAASVSQMARFETELPPPWGKLDGLSALNRAWVERAAMLKPERAVVLDLDSSESPTHALAAKTQSISPFCGRAAAIDAPFCRHEGHPACRQ